MNEIKESPLEKACNFLKPSKVELVIMGVSLIPSYILGMSTYIVTKNPYYSAMAAASPQLIEYTLFRSMEIGIFGERSKELIKKIRDLEKLYKIL